MQVILCNMFPYSGDKKSRRQNEQVLRKNTALLVYYDRLTNRPTDGQTGTWGSYTSNNKHNTSLHVNLQNFKIVLARLVHHINNINNN